MHDYCEVTLVIPYNNSYIHEMRVYCVCFKDVPNTLDKLVSGGLDLAFRMRVSCLSLTA